MKEYMENDKKNDSIFTDADKEYIAQIMREHGVDKFEQEETNE